MGLAPRALRALAAATHALAETAASETPSFTYQFGTRLDVAALLAAASTTRGGLPVGGVERAPRASVAGAEDGGPSLVAPIPRIHARDMSRDIFAVLVRQGQPVVIEEAFDHAGADFRLRDVTCKQFGEQLAAGTKFHQEYTGRGHDRNDLWFQDIEKIIADGALGSAQIDDVAVPEGGPQLRPFYSDVVKAHESEADRGWGDRALVRKTVSFFKHQIVHHAPSWARPESARQDAAWRREVEASIEFWVEQRRAGAKAHVDGHCSPTLQLVSSGVKRWRLMPLPVRPRADYSDGLIYDRRAADGDAAADAAAADAPEWQPWWQSDVRAGEAVLFPPSFIHETVSVGDECSVATTVQLGAPAPAGFYARNFERMAHVEELAPCWAVASQLALLGAVAPPATAPKTMIRAAKNGFAVADADGDGVLSREELDAFLERGDSGVLAADDVLAYLDSDGSDSVQLPEIIAGVRVLSRGGRAIRRFGSGGEQEEL